VRHPVVRDAGDVDGARDEAGVNNLQRVRRPPTFT
jgi:hypothetical protein